MLFPAILLIRAAKIYFFQPALFTELAAMNTAARRLA
jgi:hypothetical protein